MAPLIMISGKLVCRAFLGIKPKHDSSWALPTSVARAENFNSFSSVSCHRRWARARCVPSVYRSTDCANRYAISESTHRLRQRRLAGHQIPTVLRDSDNVSAYGDASQIGTT